MMVPPQIMGIKFRAVIIARLFSQQPGMGPVYSGSADVGSFAVLP
jgi:hypothetical protein